MTFKTMAQPELTFIYEITLFERFKHQSMWTEREHKIHQAHIEYLDSLTRNRTLLLAGITDQGMVDHQGMIILQTDSYEEAWDIIQKDPSVKKGMMSARIRPFQIYFKSAD